MRPLLSLPRGLALAALSGVLMSLAFAPVAFGPSAIVSVALLTTAVWGGSWRRGLGLGFVSGLLFFGLLLGWMRVIGWDAWLLLSAFWALWFALVGVGTALVTRLPGAPVWVASMWVLQETLRAHLPFGGFPWGEIAFAQPDTPFARLAPIGGSPLVSFAVAFVGASIVTLVLDYRAGRRRWAATWFAAAVGITLLPALAPVTTTGDTEVGPASTVLAYVQGGTPQVGMGAMDVRRAVLDNHVAQTLDLAQAVADGEVPRPSFVLWPENSSDLDPFIDASAAEAISTAAKAVGAPILVGAVVNVPDDPTGIWNVGIVWDPVVGPQEMYIKTHPVPFGEYIPFRAFLAQHIARFDRVPRDFLAGSRPGNLDINGIPVGNVICFEIAYRDVVDAVVDGGARLITVQTNNATYGGTAQPEQQLAISRLRAMEFGRSVVVAATSGISAVIDPAGTVVERMDEDEVGWRVTDVALRGQTTLATKTAPAVQMLLCAAALGAAATAMVQSVRRRRRPIA
ncbi:MAG: apolipoprotein N-acyltransferase [Actinobacteria bacterium]|nr:apolipoprotein N-acyltransferase [Actinomycetota bacterium]